MLSVLFVSCLGETILSAGGDASHVQSASAAAAALAPELGGLVEVAHDLKGIPVLLDEPGATARQRLGDLAFALHASLVRDGRILRIERTAEDRKTLREVRQRVLERRFADGLAKHAALLRRSDALGDVAAQVRAAKARVAETFREATAARAVHQPYAVPDDLVNPGDPMPASRLAFGLLQRIGARRLAQLPPGGIAFFSDRPNAVELPLPPARDLLEAYARKTASEGGGDALAGGKLVLRVDETGGVLHVYDASGRQTDLGGVDYANRVVYLGPEVPMSPTPRPIVLTSEESTLEAFLHVSDEQLRANAMRSYAGLPPLAAPPDDYLHPERRDPLDFAVREGVLATPHDPKGRFVAVLADWTLDLAHECAHDGKLDADAFARGLLRGGEFGRIPFERVARDALTVLRPADDLATEAALADRTALGRGLRRLVVDGRIGLRNGPALHLDLYPSRRSVVAQRYLGALQAYGLPGIVSIGFPGDGKLALIGAMQARTGSSASGGETPFRTILRDGLLAGWLGVKPGPSASDLAVAPSTLLAEDRLSAAQLELTHAEPLVGDMGSNPKAPFDGLPPERLGTDDLYVPGETHTEARTKARIEAKYLKRRYRIGRLVTVGLDVRIEGCAPIHFEIHDPTLDRADLTFDELPEVFRNAIAENVRKVLNGEYTPALAPGTRVVPPPR